MAATTTATLIARKNKMDMECNVAMKKWTNASLDLINWELIAVATKNENC